jgi:hypothetical protein
MSYFFIFPCFLIILVKVPFIYARIINQRHVQFVHTRSLLFKITCTKNHKKLLLNLYFFFFDCFHSELGLLWMLTGKILNCGVLKLIACWSNYSRADYSSAAYVLLTNWSYFPSVFPSLVLGWRKSTSSLYRLALSSYGDELQLR